MIWSTNCALLAFLLAISALLSSQYADGAKFVNDPAENIGEDAEDMMPPIDIGSENIPEDDRGAGPNVGQSLFTPPLGQSLVPGPLNLFSLMFPALNSLLLWGNLLSGPSLLGAPPLLGSTQQSSAAQTDQLPSASKVVLVLAEDRDPHAAMRAANQEVARTIRQNDIFSQLLAQVSQADLGQMLSQSLGQLQQQNPGQLLQQILAQDLSQSLGQLQQQNPGQFLQQILAQDLSQSLGQLQQQNPGQFLQQILAQDLSQSVGQLLAQTFQQFPTLGQAPPSGEPTVGAAQDQSERGGADATVSQPPPSPSSFQLPNFQSAIDAGTQMLGQALQQPSADPTSAFQLPNFQSAFDTGSQMLGQALQQANVDPSSGGLQLPNFQSVLDSGSQILSQSGGFFNLRPFQSIDTPMSGSDPVPAASQISEVRVKPDAIATVHNPNEEHMQKMENMDEFKMMSTLHKASDHNKLPILWFRIPSDASEKEHDFDSQHKTETIEKNVDKSQLETKLKAFQRQVIRELKLLQDIDRKAKEMQAVSKGVTGKTYKDTNNHYSNFLSKIPVHKITRADIEKALNDDYVKKLLQKAAIANRKENEKTSFRKFYMPNGAQIKRDTMTSTPTGTPSQMSREDIVRLMAYAYRMANANGIRMLESSDTQKLAKHMDVDSHKTSDESSKPMERQWATDSKPPNQMAAMKPMSRQWFDERMQMPQAQSFVENPAMIPTARQMQDKMSTTMGHQRLDEEKTQKAILNRKFNNEEPKQPQIFEMIEQPRQAMEQSPQMHSQHATDQRQWVEQKDDIRSGMQENAQGPMQRQWIDTHAQNLPSEIIRQQQQQPIANPVGGRMWAEQQPHVAVQQPKLAMQQQEMVMQQPQKVEQQPQMVMQQPPMAMQQQPMVMQQPPMITQQQPMVMQLPPMAMQQQPMVMQQPPMAMQQPQFAMQQPQMAMQQPQGDIMMLQQMSPQTQESADLLGEATPQMPENAEKARHKGATILDEFDLFGYGRGYHGYHGKHKGKGKSHGALIPATINYYYNAGGHVPIYGYGGSPAAGYGHGYGHGSSYGTSYGSSYGPSYGSAKGGDYSSSGYAVPAYRMAVGDDEIRTLLKEHYRTKIMTQPDTNHQIVPTAAFLSTTPASDNSHHQHTSSQPDTPTFSESDKPNSTTPAATPATTDSSKTPRLDCKLRLNDILDKGKSCGGDWVRQKRNTNYGTIETIDADSLSELRKTYKESLKEITLKPDEDPAEALMRYNAASIQEALVNANREPMEITTDVSGMPTIDAEINEPYFNGAQVPVFNQEHALGYAADHHYQHYNRELVGQPANAQQQHVDIHEKANKILTHKQDHAKTLDSCIQNTSSHSNTTYIDDKHKTLSSLPESELKIVFELIKQQMQTCCEKCRDRIILGIKENIREEHARESLQKEDHRPTKKHAPHSRAVKAFELEPNKTQRNDEQFDKWLYEMEAKGYDSKYLTKSHHWDYLNSGKLTLALDSNEGEQRADNEITKKTNEQQSTKRCRHINSQVDYEEHRSKVKAFANKIPALNDSIKEDAHAVNDKLRHLKDDAQEVTSSPYEMRGKFKNTKVNKTKVGTTTDKTPVKFNALSEQLPVDTNKAKAVEIVGLLYDLSNKTESANNKSQQVSVMAKPIVATSTEGPAQAPITTKATKPKRRRSRRKQKTENEIATQPPDQSSVTKR